MTHADHNAVPQPREAQQGPLEEVRAAARDEPKLVPAHLAFLIVGVGIASMVGVAVFRESIRFRNCDTLCQEGFMRFATPELVAEKIQQGARPRALLKEDQTTALHWAAKFSPDPAVPALLINLGAALDARDRIGATPLHYAANANPDPEVSGLLLQLGAAVHALDVTNGTPLHYAAQSNSNPDVAELLIQRGADVAAPGEVGRTPLHYAAWTNDNPALLAALLRHGADPMARDEFGVTPLHYAALSNHVPEVTGVLLEHGADPNAQTRVDGMTPLHAAAREGRAPEVLALLLENGADPGLLDKDDKLALDYAEQNPTLRKTEVYERLRRASPLHAG